MQPINKYFALRRDINRRSLVGMGLLFVLVGIISAYFFATKIHLNYTHETMGTQKSWYSFSRFGDKVYWKHGSAFSSYIELPADKDTFKTIHQTLAYDKNNIYLSEKPLSVATEQFKTFALVRCESNPIYLISDVANNVYEVDGWHLSTVDTPLELIRYIDNTDTPNMNPLTFELESRCTKILEK